MILQQTMPPHKLLIVDGRVAPKRTDRLSRAGVVLLEEAKLARIELGGRTVFLRKLRLMTRPSGRHLHLARYLVGFCTVSGLRLEIFLGVVEGVRNGLFKIRLALQGGLVRLASLGLPRLKRLSLALG